MDYSKTIKRYEECMRLEGKTKNLHNLIRPKI